MGKVDKSLMKQKKKVHSVNIVRALRNISITNTDINELATDITEKMVKQAERNNYQMELQEAGLWNGPPIKQKWVLITNFQQMHTMGGIITTFRYRS